MRLPEVSLGAAARYNYAALLTGQDAGPFAGDCVHPREIVMRGVDSHALHNLRKLADPEGEYDFAPGHGFVGPLGALPKQTVAVAVRCRKCPPCLKARARRWAAKAIDEWRGSARTWFGTITLNPEAHFVFRCRADVKCQSERFEALACLDTSEQFRLGVAQVAPELTKWIKRVRKSIAPARVRYLLVTEAHKSGLPHFHILLHQVDESGPTKRQLEAQWPYGFTNWRLVKDGGAAAYVCKYLAKSALTRVRASQNYGGHLVADLTERLLDATRPSPGPFAASGRQGAGEAERGGAQHTLSKAKHTHPQQASL